MEIDDLIKIIKRQSEAKKENTSLRARVKALEGVLNDVNCDATFWKERCQAFEEEVKDWRRSAERAASEDCGDEKHCTCVPLLRKQLAEALRVLELCADMPDNSVQIMRQEGLKIDDLKNPMQKLAFTLHTEMCEIASMADRILDENEEFRAAINDAREEE